MLVKPIKKILTRGRDGHQPGMRCTPALQNRYDLRFGARDYFFASALRWIGDEQAEENKACAYPQLGQLLRSGLRSFPIECGSGLRTATSAEPLQERGELGIGGLRAS